MKSKYCLLTIFQIIIFISCNKNVNIVSPIEENETKKLFIKNITIKLLDTFDSQQKPIPNITVLIDSVNYKSNSMGIVQIDSLLKGKHKIEIADEYFAKIDTTISISDSLKSYLFNMAPYLDDYFPLLNNSKWIYKYHFLYQGYGVILAEIRDGILSETIVKIDTLSEAIKYNIKENFTGTIFISKWNDSTQSIDTSSYYTESSKYYSISQDNSSKVKYSILDSVPYFYFESLLTGIKRYYPKYNGNIINIISGTTEYNLVKNIGIDSLYNYSGGMNRSSKTLKLIDYKK